MKKSLRSLSLLLLAWLTTGNSLALTEREDFEHWCRRETSAAGAGRCLGYLLAAEDVLSQDSIEGVRACMPRSITLNEMHALVLSWLQAHPEAQAGTAMGLIARALAARYPCPPAH